MNPSSNTFEKILHCAQALIVAGGYNGFSYADIAKVVGIRNASIHHHFPSKEILVHTLVVQYREEAKAGIAALERSMPNPIDQLRTYTAYWEHCFADKNASFCVCALLASEIQMLPENIALEIRAHFRMLSAWLASVFERAAQQGGLQLNASAKTEAEIFMAMVHGAMLSARAYDDGKMFGAIVNPMLERLIKD